MLFKAVENYDQISLYLHPNPIIYRLFGQTSFTVFTLSLIVYFIM